MIVLNLKFLMRWSSVPVYHVGYRNRFLKGYLHFRKVPLEHWVINNRDYSRHARNYNNEYQTLRLSQNQAEDAMDPRKKLKIFRWCFISLSTVRKQTEGTIGLM